VSIFVAQTRQGGCRGGIYQRTNEVWEGNTSSCNPSTLGVLRSNRRAGGSSSQMTEGADGVWVSGKKKKSGGRRRIKKGGGGGVKQ